MKIKIGSLIFDSKKEPILIEFTKQDITNIRHMSDTSYCVAPSVYSKNEIESFKKEKNIENHFPKISVQEIRRRKDLINILNSIINIMLDILKEVKLSNKLKKQINREINKLKKFIYG